MKNIVIILGHPDAAGGHYCHAVAEAYRLAAAQAGHMVTVLDVARSEVTFLRTKEEWESNTVPDYVRDAQTAIKDADHIVMIYPLWMGDVPALLKAWIEQVFRKGFAFEMDGQNWHGALKGKSARVIVTMGMPGFFYRWFFFAHSLRSLDRNILKFCGIRPVRWSIVGNVEDPSGKVQKKFLETAGLLGSKGM